MVSKTNRSWTLTTLSMELEDQRLTVLLVLDAKTLKWNVKSNVRLHRRCSKEKRKSSPSTISVISIRPTVRTWCLRIWLQTLLDVKSCKLRTANLLQTRHVMTNSLSSKACTDALKKPLTMSSDQESLKVITPRPDPSQSTLRLSRERILTWVHQLVLTHSLNQVDLPSLLTKLRQSLAMKVTSISKRKRQLSALLVPRAVTWTLETHTWKSTFKLVTSKRSSKRLSIYARREVLTEFVAFVQCSRLWTATEMAHSVLLNSSTPW